MNTLAEQGIKSLIVKGWAIAREYPEPGLRPYGDFDLIFSSDDYPKAAELFARSGGIWPVDSHNGPEGLTDRSIEELYKRSKILNLEGAEVLVPCAEDHLRILCCHLVKHGLRRPLWSCDIAVMLESLPEEFDWDYFLGSNPIMRSWIANTILLVGKLLGAKIDTCPGDILHTRLARWMEKVVISQWSSPFSEQSSDPDPMSRMIWKPLQVPAAIRRRWPNAFEACFNLGVPFDYLPRISMQLTAGLIRSARFMRSLPYVTRKST